MVILRLLFLAFAIFVMIAAVLFAGSLLLAGGAFTLALFWDVLVAGLIIGLIVKLVNKKK